MVCRFGCLSFAQFSHPAKNNNYKIFNEKFIHVKHFRNYKSGNIRHTCPHCWAKTELYVHLRQHINKNVVLEVFFQFEVNVCLMFVIVNKKYALKTIFWRQNTKGAQRTCRRCSTVTRVSSRLLEPWDAGKLNWVVHAYERQRRPPIPLCLLLPVCDDCLF